MLTSHFFMTEIIKSGYDFINAASERVDSTILVEYVLVSLLAAFGTAPSSSTLV